MNDSTWGSAQLSPPAPKQQRKVLGSSLIGTTIEHYDFFLYGSAAALIFGPQFFPSDDPLAGTLAAFATFAVGFLARPIGAVAIGHFGDRLGRRKMLIFSMLLMGIPTTLIGLLPNYDAIGVFAPILLVLLRFTQGLALSGEWAGAVLMAVEYSPKHRRALYGAFPAMGLPLGIITANLAFIAVTTLFTPEFFQNWGWRIPFLLSGALILVALYLRFSIDESPAFEATKKTSGVERNPLRIMIVKHGRAVLLGGLISVAPPAIGYIFSVYVLLYATDVLGMAQSTMLWLIIFGACVNLISVYIGAVLADRLRQKSIFVLGAIIVTVWAFPFFMLIDTARPGLITLSFALMLFGSSLMAGTQPAILAELFPSSVRYSGTAVTYQIGAIAGGGFAPLIATTLYAAFNSSVPISLYLLVLGLVVLISIAVLRVGRYGASFEEGWVIDDRDRSE